MIRLDLLLVRRHPGLSRRRAREAIERGQVTVDGIMVRMAGQPVRDDAEVHWNPNRRALPRARLSLDALHEDADVLIVDKPAGLLSVPSAPGARHEDTVVARVREYVGRLRPRRPYVHPVHRLDRDTSGCLALALSPPARAGLQALFRAHGIERRYLALVEGRPRSEQGTIDLPIADTYEGGRRRLARGGDEQSPARTRWRVRERLEGAALLEVELETGRQHQVRLHLSHIGLPVIGDRVYRREGARSVVNAARQMLHAEVLAFVHPVTGQSIRAVSPLPDDFRRLLARLRG
jgi:23S rRNA pseudouridine1911/1915/1917 synthase